MEQTTTIQFFAMFGIFFIICIAIMIRVNHQLMKSADKRLASANEMVITLAHSADTLSNSLSALKDLTVDMKQTDDAMYLQLEKNRDDFRQAYEKLLTRYKLLEEKLDHTNREYIETLRLLADRPVINNNHTHNELT